MSIAQLDSASTIAPASNAPQPTLPQNQVGLELGKRIEKEFAWKSENQNLPLPQSQRSSWVVVDRGCGHGPNSDMVFDFFENAVRKYSDSPIHSICNDRDPEQLNELAAQNGKPKSLKNGGRVYRTFNCSSFLDQLLPEGSVDLVCSNMALHWLDLKHPTAGVSSLGGVLLPGLVGRMAEVQWNRLYESVRRELRTGGKLIVSFVVQPPGDQSHLPLRILSDAVNKVLNAPSFDQNFCFDAAVPVYLRDNDEVLRPFNSDNITGTKLRVDSYEVLPMSCPYFERYRTIKNAAEFANEYSNHIRGFSELSIRKWLMESGFSSISMIVEDIYSEIRNRIRHAPNEFQMNRYIGFLTATKR